MRSKLKTVKKNLLLITIDALRLDHLSITGYKKKTTPFIDKVAKKGYFFTNTIVNGPCTPPSFSSIFTSTYPFHQDGYLPLPYNKTTLAEVMRANGYKTVAIHSTPLLSRFYGYDRGFDIFYDGMFSKDDSTLKKSLFSSFLTKGDFLNDFMNWIQSIKIPKKFLYYFQVAFYTKIVGRKKYYEKAKKLLTMAYKWIKKYKQKAEKKPFFLWVHLMEPHDPYFPYNRYLRKIKAKRLSYTEIEYIRDHPEYMHILREYNKRQKLLNLYDAEIRYLNAMMRKFFRKLKYKKRETLKNTLVIITADHGEEFNEHGMYGHNAQLYDELLKVPLIIVPEPLKKVKKDKTRKFPKNYSKINFRTNLINMLDLAPTILDLLGLPPESSFNGKSFTHLIFSDEKYIDDPIEDGVFSESYHKNKITRFAKNSDPRIMRIISYRTKKWKYIIDEESKLEELYDLEKDPKEKVNLNKKFPKLIRKFRKKVINHIKESDEINLVDISEKKKILNAIAEIKIDI